MFGILIQTTVDEENCQEFIQACKVLTRLCRENRCCVGQSLYRDVFNGELFLWTEQWNDEDSLKAHMKTERFRSLIGAIEVLGKLDYIQMIQFDDVTRNHQINFSSSQEK